VPPLTGFHHLSLTVTDVEASVQWYGRVLGFERVMVEKHDGGYTEVLHRPGTSLFLGLHRHDRNDGARFAETTTGLDHLAFHVADRDAFDEWVAHLDRLGIEHSPPFATNDPFPYVLVVFRDPDNIQLEVIWA
jgi:catechol 2,3-dioxygenase-like lactoylglutathione lyase family enzyme